MVGLMAMPQSELPLTASTCAASIDERSWKVAYRNWDGAMRWQWTWSLLNTFMFVPVNSHAGGSVRQWSITCKPVRKLKEHVVGIDRHSSNIVPTTDSDQFGNIYVSPTLLYSLGPDWRRYQAFDGTYVRLKPGTSRVTFARQVQRLATKFPSTGGSVFVADENQQAAGVEQAIRPEAIALGIFGLIAGLTTLLIVVQLVVRQLFAGAADFPILKAMGMTRVQFAVAGVVESSMVVFTGGMLAAVIAILASPLTPIGPARLAEPFPGFRVDLPVLGMGVVAIVALIAAIVAWPVWRISAVNQRSRVSGLKGGGNRTPLTRSLEGAGIPLVASLGIPRGADVGARSPSGSGTQRDYRCSAVSGYGDRNADLRANFLHLIHTPNSTVRLGMRRSMSNSPRFPAVFRVAWPIGRG